MKSIDLRLCRQCGAHGWWRIEDIEGIGEDVLAWSCDSDLADVLRSIENVHPVVIEVLS